ncbi:MAG: translation initiation factor IF-3 [Candidatus Binatia bacterium]
MQRPASTPSVRINQQIRAREVRLIDVDGTQNVVPLTRALEIATQRSLDLVEVAATAVPPVCRIMDYGKFRYMQRKKAAESKKKQTRVQVKEVKLGSRTDDHDVNFKVEHIRRFLAEGMRVKVSVFFRGREITHPEKGREMLDLVMTKVEDVASQELRPRLEGRSMSMMVVPK